MWCCCFFFVQAEDGIRDLVRSRWLGDVYKRQVVGRAVTSEIGRVSLCGIRIKIVCPNRHKDLSEELGKTERKATSATEKVYQLIAWAGVAQ